MKINPDFLSPCGLYCGVCAIYIAHRDTNEKFKKRLVDVYQGKVDGKGTLPGSETLSTKDIHCSGCLSDVRFMHCRQCEIRNCVAEKEIAGCHECDEFPCEHIEHFPMTVGKKVILRSIPHIRNVGVEKWARDEQARYICPECGARLFRGAARCNQCQSRVDLDWLFILDKTTPDSLAAPPFAEGGTGETGEKKRNVKKSFFFFLTNSYNTA